MDLRDHLREGVRYSLQPPQWIRGPALVDGEDVVLEQRQRELYQPQEADGLHAGLEATASRAVAHAITSGLGDARVRLVAEVEASGEPQEPGVFMFFFEPTDLFGYTFSGAADLIVQKGPVAECP